MNTYSHNWCEPKVLIKCFVGERHGGNEVVDGALEIDGQTAALYRLCNRGRRVCSPGIYPDCFSEEAASGRMSVFNSS